MSQHDDRSSAMDEYDRALSESKNSSAKYMGKFYVAEKILFCAGLWAVYEHSTFLAVLLLGLTAYCNRESSDAAQEIRIMSRQRLLATLINKRLNGIEDALKEIREGK